MAKVTPENLGDTINKILEDYAEDETKKMDDAVKAVAKAGAKALQNSSKGTFGGSGKYAKGWTAQKETVARYKTIYTIWNKNQPGLPHLLEYGHAKRKGGRTPGKTHIEPVTEKLIVDFEKELSNKL